MHNKAIYAAILAVFYLSASCVAAQPEPLLLVVDFSGSMNEVQGQKRKIEQAKAVLRGLLADFPAQAKLGTVFYGHRRAKDCSDIEVVSPIVQTDAALLSTLSQRIQNLQAKGETPIAESLVQTIPLFGGMPGRVILVTDGKEECGGDVCAAAKRLAASGISIRVDIVGFDLTDEARRLLSCVTETTGGKFYTAQTADELRGALDRASGEAVGGVLLEVAVTEGNKLVPRGALVKIYSGGQVVRSLDVNPGRVRLPAGEYELTASVNMSPDSEPQKISLEEGKDTKTTIEVGAGTLEVTPGKGAAGSFSERVRIEVYQNGRLVGASSERPPRFELRAGTYQVRAALNSMQVHELGDIEIKAGEVNRRNAVLPAAEVRILVEGKYRPGSGPYPYLQLSSGGRSVLAVSDNPAALQLLEGGYEAAVIENEVETAKTGFKVEAGKDQEIHLPVPAAAPGAQ